MLATPGRAWLEALWKRALARAQGQYLVQQALDSWQDGDHPGPPGRRVVIAAGKAASSMAMGAAAVWGEQIDLGCVITKDGHGQAPPGWMLWEASHPVPDQRSVAAATWVLQQVDAMQTGDHLLFLLSGGASALLTAPVDGLPLSVKARLVQALLRCGADIYEINCVRKHLSEIKGGGLLRRLPPATGVTLAMSDVPGDHPDAIGSGPSVPDPTTFAQAMQVMETYQLSSSFPEVTKILRQGVAGQRRETLKPSPEWQERMPFQCLASNRWMLEVLQSEAKKHIEVVLIDETMDRPLQQVLDKVIDEINCLQGRTQPVLLLIGGEPTLQVGGGGLGGRMQHLALCVAMAIINRTGLWFFAAGTDGTDGPTEVAGAIVDGQTVAHARSLGYDARVAAQAFDSYKFHQAAQTLLETGPTGTHLGDVAMILWHPEISSDP